MLLMVKSFKMAEIEKNLNLRLPIPVHSKLKAVASLENKTIKQYVLDIILEKINHEGQL